MKLLELFSGTKSVGKVAEQLGYEVTSLDLKNADINCDIMNWNYTVYESGHFDVIWASPPCTEYSCAKTVGVGYIDKANDIVLRTIEIIEFLNPKYHIIDYPHTGKLKDQWMMIVFLMLMLIIASTECPTEKEHDYGVMYLSLNQDLYVRKTVILGLVINILFRHNTLVLLDQVSNKAVYM